MPPSFLERLAQTRRQVRRLVWLHGLCWLIAGVLAAVAVVGLTDWLFHVSSGMRVLFWVMLLALGGYLVVRHLIRPLSVKLTDLYLAQRIERLHPELQEQLSSSIDFLRHSKDDALLGSKVLRDRVVAAAVEATGELQFEEIVESKPVRVVGLWTLAVCCVVAGLVIASPSDAAIALRRLANPFGGPDWPQRTQLELVSFPRKVPKGDAFEVTVAATGDVPNRVVVRYRFDDENVSAPEPLRPTAENQFRGGLDSVTRSFDFAVSGGDATTEWMHVDVVPAPEVTDLKLSLAYPAYTGLSPEEFPEGRGHVRAVVGTKVSVHARSNKALERAQLQWEKGEPTVAVIGDDGYSLTAEFTVTENGRYQVILFDTEGMSNSYRSPKPYRVEAIEDRKPDITIQEPAGDIEVTSDAELPLRALIKDDFGNVSFDLHYEKLSGDQQAAEKKVVPLGKLDQPEKLTQVQHLWALSPLGLAHGNVIRFHLEALDSKTPEPNVGKSQEIHIRVVTKEDFLQRLDNEQQLVREELERVLKMQQNALTQVDELEKQANIVGQLNSKEVERLQSAEMVQRRVREKLNDSEQSVRNQVRRLLDELKNNKVNDVESSKRLVLMESELARVSEQHLPPISDALTEAEKQARRQFETRSGAPDANRAPQSARSETGDSSETNGDSPDQPKDDGRQPGLKDGQAKAGEAKAGDSKAGDSKAGDSKAGDSKAGDSKAGDSKAGDSKSGEAKAKEANKEGAEKAEAGKSDQAKDGQPNAGDPAKADPAQPDAEQNRQTQNPVGENLQQAKEHQQQVVASLSQMLDQLNEWETIHQVASDARELQRHQVEVNEQVKEISNKTLGKKTEDLSAEERAEIAKAASRQDDAREQFLRLQRKMNRLADNENQTDPMTADMLKERLDQLSKDNVGGRMGDSAAQIRNNRMADANQQQEQIAKSLQELVSALENRQEQELARLVKKLKEAEQDLEQIREEQRQLLKKTQEAEKIQDPQQREEELKRLQRRQQELQQKAEEFAKRLSRLRADQASRHSGRAAGRMRSAGQQMQGQGQQQREQAQQQQQDALEELQQAQEELAKAREQAEEQLAEEQLAKISDSLRQIHQREIGVKEELMRLEGLRQAKGRLTRGELHSILSLSRAQEGLAKEAEQLTEKLSQAKVFVMVIEEAVEFMNDAAERLGQRQTDLPTQVAVDSAASRFAQLLESLQRDKDEGKGRQQQQQQQAGGGGGGGGGGQDGIPNIAQIKLLRNLQKELLEQTVQLAKAKEGDRKWTPEQEKLFESMSKRQGRLADLVREISEPAAEEDPMRGEL